MGASLGIRVPCFNPTSLGAMHLSVAGPMKTSLLMRFRVWFGSTYWDEIEGGRDYCVILKKLTQKCAWWNYKKNTSSEDSISDSSLDTSTAGFSGKGGSGGWGEEGTGGGSGGVGNAILKGAGMFILFIKCNTYSRVESQVGLWQKNLRNISFIIQYEKHSYRL